MSSPGEDVPAFRSYRVRHATADASGPNAGVDVHTTQKNERSTGTTGRLMTKAIPIGGLVVLLAAALLAAATRRPQQNDSAKVALNDGSNRRHLGPGVVVAWNELAYDIAFAEDQFLTFKGQRA